MIETEKRTVDEVKLVENLNQIHLRTRRLVSFSAISDWVTRRMANFKGGKRKQSEGAKAKFWSLQEPGSEASVSEAAPGVPEPNGCERLRMVANIETTCREQQTPRVKREPFATHSGKKAHS